MEHGKRSWSYAKQQHVAYPLYGDTKTNGLDEYRNPRELGCRVGDILRSYPTNGEFKQPFRIQDLFVQDAEEQGRSDAPQDADSSPVATVILKAGGGIWSMSRPIPRPPQFNYGYVCGYGCMSTEDSYQNHHHTHHRQHHHECWQQYRFKGLNTNAWKIQFLRLPTEIRQI